MLTTSRFFWRTMAASSLYRGGSVTSTFPMSRAVSSSASPSSDTQNRPAPAALPNLDSEKRSTAVRKHLFFRLLEHVVRVDRLLPAILPKKAIDLSRLFVSGTGNLLTDMRRFADIYHVLSATKDWEKACRSLTRRQLELYMLLPGELYRVGPFMLACAAPMAQYALFPIGLMYPKMLLSSHFWTDAQKAEVDRDRQAARHKFYRPLLRDVQKTLSSLKGGKSSHLALKSVCSALSAGDTPTVDSILGAKRLFQSDRSLHLSQISSVHARHLKKVHGLGWSLWWAWRDRLQQHANLLRQMDLAIVREDLGAMTERDLRACCLMRGLNAAVAPPVSSPSDTPSTPSPIKGSSSTSTPPAPTTDDMRAYLRQWVEVSGQLDADAASLLLHLPILLGYNHPSRIWDTQTVN